MIRLPPFIICPIVCGLVVRAHTHETTRSHSLVRTGEFEGNQRSLIGISDGIQLVYEYHSEIGEF